MTNRGIQGEYLPHQGTLIMYPFRGDIWRDGAKHIRAYILDLVEKISAREIAYLIVDPSHEQEVRHLESPSVKIIPLEYDDIWIRDTAPTFVHDKGSVFCLDWRFNAWGGKKEGAFYPWRSDNNLAGNLGAYFGLPVRKPPVTLEGGAILSDGNGTLFTTRSVVLNRNRNVFRLRELIEPLLKLYTKMDQVVWLDKGLYMDETNGHIDNMMSVINANTLCLAWTDNPKSPNYDRVRSAYNVLKNARDVDGKPYEIVQMPLPEIPPRTQAEADAVEKNPKALERKCGDVLPATYLNFYHLNNAVLFPVFDCVTDAQALSIIRGLFPEKEILPVYSREPLLGGGGLHCLLHEVPVLPSENGSV